LDNWFWILASLFSFSFFLILLFDIGLLNLKLCYLFHFFLSLFWSYITGDGLIELTRIYPGFFSRFFLMKLIFFLIFSSDIKLLFLKLCDFSVFFYIGLSWVRVNSSFFNVLLFLLLGYLFKNLIFFISVSHHKW